MTRGTLYKVIILANENEDDHIQWLNACKDFSKQVDYRVVNLTHDNWMEEINKKPFDILLAKPPRLSSLFKQLYDERIFVLNHVLHYPVYPALPEILLYENKRFLSYWLKANKIPHPETHVFYDKNEALFFLSNTSYPVVGKSNIGASGSGVKILHNPKKAKAYLNLCYSEKGAPRRWGPNVRQGHFIKRGLHYIRHPHDIKRKAAYYVKVKNENQKGFVVIQEYIEHKFEWRVVRIGNSFFAHKKIVKGDKASGSLIKSYENPPFQLLDFVKRITDKFKLYSQAIDIFEITDGQYLVNEMQCIFGQSDPYQMLVDGKPGRYRYLNDKWIFEEGDYTRNECFNLRLDFIINDFSKNKI